MTAWKLTPEPTFKFRKLEGAEALQSLHYALRYDFVGIPIAAGGERIASLFAPRNPTISGSILRFIPRIDAEKKAFDVHVEHLSSGSSAGGGGGGGGAGGGGAGSGGGSR